MVRKLNKFSPESGLLRVSSTGVYTYSTRINMKHAEYARNLHPLFRHETVALIRKAQKEHRVYPRFGSLYNTNRNYVELWASGEKGDSLNKEVVDLIDSFAKKFKVRIGKA